MPNCFQLISRKTKEATKFSQIDEEICKLFDAPVHPKRYFEEWYDFFGWRIAVSGMKLDSPELIAAAAETCIREDDTPEIKEDLRKIAERREKIRAYLHENYTTDAWAEIGRR